MGLHIAWDGPQIYAQLLGVALLAWGIVYLVKRV